MASVQVLAFADAGALAAAAAARWLEAIEAASRRDALFHVALPGGRVIRRFFDAAVDQARRRGTSFRHVRFFWGDERCVPPDDPESNFGLARKHLLDPLEIAAAQVHRIRGEDEPTHAAAVAGQMVHSLLPADGQGRPVFDLVLLGMGEDGHVASLFAGYDTIPTEGDVVYLPVVGPKPPPRRITLSYATLAAARSVWVLASGRGKERALQDSLSPDGRTPLACLLRRRSGTVVFTDLLVADRAAA